MMDLACPKWVITGLPHRGNQALLFDRGFKVDDETRFWSAEPPGGPRALRPSEFDRHGPRPVNALMPTAPASCRTAANRRWGPSRQSRGLGTVAHWAGSILP